MKVGDKVRVRFATLPENSPGSSDPYEIAFPIREAVIVYIHPKGRYIVASTEVDGKEVRETFRKSELLP